MTTPSPYGEPAIGPVDTARWVLPTLAPILAVGGLAVAVVGPETAWRELSAASVWALLMLALLAPIVLVAGLRTPGALRASSVAGVFLVLTALSVSMPRMGVFADLEWNWQGKLLDLVWVGVLFIMLRRWASTEAGLRWRPEPGSLRSALPPIIGIFVVVAGMTILSAILAPGSVAVPNAERLLFDATVPNLTEELIWRGAMLAVLDRAFGTPWRFFGAPAGMGLVLTSIGFGLGHGVLFDPVNGVAVNLGAIVATGIAGLFLGWVRARTGCLWLAFLAHCAPELGVDLGALLAA
ncbi:CPBP family intramembrane glutamic endopeptidase [Actinoalloteichus hymeniacidonis]|uniref:CAAX protease self-immunity n=1 Tax=Actinoalloteichus hymeniacidonis TaxID=340345 RepID=A0AAC9MXI7_9PSEU|nr:CPBP family intramembrane glutamic endopeptidase [Actinoalloteichus hymeniacidonis]AOS62086.1 CAAX protease self-immunity [Actinoalloteichus hymeniacidonis]MBB5909892.1 membrane protease YdiL (CAAX protease family) [Actinoalloteichus hymeniacidonis]